jgi:hypothetical protein
VRGLSHDFKGVLFFQSCVHLLRNDPDSHIETCPTSSDGENQVIGVKVEEVTETEEEWDPQPSTSGTVTT